MWNYLNALYIRFMLSMKSQKGQTMVEYALIIVLIALAAILAMKFLGGTVNNTYCNAGQKLTNP